MRWLFIWLLPLLLWMPTPAAAHPLAPVALTVRQGADEVVATLKRARVQPRGAAFAPRFPVSCTRVGPPVLEEATSFVRTSYRLRCDALTGARFGIDGLTEADVDGIIIVHLRDGRVVEGLVDRSDDHVAVPAAPSWSETSRAFAASGLRHLLAGWDHLLFVLGLALLLRQPRRVLLALTAFTAGHALSMGAATLGVIDVPSAWAEVAIALSLVWLARELVIRDADERDAKRPYVAALGIGLVHGLGFAAAFTTAGVSAATLPLALGSFHLGIELGQVLVVVPTLVVLAKVRAPRRWEIPAAYVMGGLAFMWLLERGAPL